MSIAVTTRSRSGSGDARARSGSGSGDARARSRAAHPAGAESDPNPPLAEVPAAPAFPTDDDVRRVAHAQHPLSVSVLMRTTPAPRMGVADRERLQGLVRDAGRRLAEERDGRDAAQVEARLSAALARAVAAPTDAGIALLVSPVETHVFHLRVRPVDRVVVDPTFATRDMVRSAAEDPAFLLLVIDGRAARLFHYDQRYARPVLGHDFPIIGPAQSLRDRGMVGAQGGVLREARRSFLRQVDSRLAQRLVDRSLPVVLVASERMAAEFVSMSRGRRISAVVRTGDTRVPLAELESRARAALTEHVTDRSAAALDTIHARLRQRRAAIGLAEAWAALLQVDPELLVVERSFAAAVMLDDAGFRLAGDPEQPGVIDDAVDELIEAVLVRGGQVVMVPDGALAHHGHLVLSVRGRPARAVR
jgi:hypothetical protein